MTTAVVYGSSSRVWRSTFSRIELGRQRALGLIGQVVVRIERLAFRQRRENLLLERRRRRRRRAPRSARSPRIRTPARSARSAAAARGLWTRSTLLSARIGRTLRACSSRSTTNSIARAGRPVASTTSTTTSASRSASMAASTIRRFIRCIGLWMPGVSMNTICAAGVLRTPTMRWRVVCGLSETIATFWPTKRLSSVDLPAFGRPTSATKPGLHSARLGGGARPAPDRAPCGCGAARPRESRRPGRRTSNRSPTAGTRPTRAST